MQAIIDALTAQVIAARRTATQNVRASSESVARSTQTVLLSHIILVFFKKPSQGQQAQVIRELEERNEASVSRIIELEARLVTKIFFPFPAFCIHGPREVNSCSRFLVLDVYNGNLSPKYRGAEENE